MPDQKKVFDALRNCATTPKCKDCPWEDCERVGHKRTTVPVTLLLDVLELLKAQEPVEPFARYDALRREFDCGACGFLVGFENAFDEHRYRAKYCPECGKRVRWE